MTRAPLSAAQRIAAASAASGIVPSALHDLRDEQLRRVGDADDALRVEVRRDLAGDERAVPLGVDARIAADEAARVERCRPWKSGSEQSTPESTIATLTGWSTVGGSAHASNAWSSWRNHCLGASGSVGVNAAAGAAAASAATASASSARRISAPRLAATSSPGRSPTRGARRRGRSRPP